MLTEVGPSAVLFMIRDGVNPDAHEEGDAQPNQSTPTAVEVLVVPNAGFKPSSDLVQSPHGPDKHGSCVPTLCGHARNDEGDDTCQEGGPISDVAMVAVFHREPELVGNTDAVEVVQRADEGQNPDDKCDDERHTVPVESIALTEEGKPALICGRVERAPCEDTGQQTGDGEDGQVSKEDVSRRLSLQIHRRDQLFAFQGIGGWERSHGVASGCQRNPKPDGGERQHGHPLMAASLVKV